MEDHPFQVLLVEDNAGDARLIQEMLQAAATARFELTSVVRLEEALRCLGQQHVDVILLDLWLPDEQGLDTFLRVHQQAPKVPIVVLTGIEDKALAVKAVRRGAQDYLVKGQFAGELLARSACYAMERKRAEQELRRREEQWRAYIEEASDLIFTLDTAGRLTSANRAVCATSGYTQEELLGRHVLDLIAPASRSDASTALAKVLNEEDVPQIEVEVLTKDGHHRVVEVRGRKFYEKGQLTGTFHIARDITERKRAEEAREEAYDIIRMSPAVAFLWRNDEGLPVEYVTENVEAVFGYTREEFISGRILYSEIVHPDDLERIAREVRTFSQEEGREEFVHEPYRIVTRAGTVRWLDHRTHIRRDATGRITHYQGLVLDITERKETEEALCESENRYRQLFEAESDAVFLIENETGRILEANRSAAAMYGYSRQELLTKQNVDLSAEPEDTQRVTQTEPVISDRIVHIPLRLHRKKDGTVFPVEITGRFFVWQGRPVHIAAIRDITERKEAEEQLKASLHEKEVLLREIYHRVKNNLQVVSSLLELQSESIQDSQIHALFQESQSRIRAMGLIHEKLYRSADLASIRAPDYFQDLVDHLLRIYGNMEQPISPVLLIDDIVLGVDTAVPCGLIVNELVSNALKHAFPPDRAPGGIVRVELRAMDTDRLALAVSDDGVGLPPALQLDSLQTLGLQLVDVLVHQLGGTIQVDRRSGTTFTITFPAHGRAEPDGEKR